MTVDSPLVILTLIDFPSTIPLQVWQFRHNQPIRVGRAHDNDVVLDHALVSRYHMEIQPQSTDALPLWQVINQGANGTFLNGALVTRSLLPETGMLQLAKDGPVLQFQILASPQVSVPAASHCQHEGNAPDNIFCIHCRELLVPVQRVIGGYRVIKTIGQGGMGTTFLALDSMSSRPSPLLVLKEMHDEMADIAKAQELFTREARVLQTLDHPGIPRYYASFVEDGRRFLAMELIHGLNLAEWVNVHGRVSADLAIDWMYQVCQILDYLHSRQPPLVHRDIKPANLILRRYDRQIVLLDFGAVKEIGANQSTRIGSNAGYTAPEQHQGRPCPQSDLYAVGATLLFLVTGKQPDTFYRRSENGSHGIDISEVSDIPGVLRSIITQLTKLDPRERIPTAAALGEMLAQCRIRH